MSYDCILKNYKNVRTIVKESTDDDVNTHISKLKFINMTAQYNTVYHVKSLNLNWTHDKKNIYTYIMLAPQKSLDTHRQLSLHFRKSALYVR